MRAGESRFLRRIAFGKCDLHWVLRYTDAVAKIKIDSGAAYTHRVQLNDYDWKRTASADEHGAFGIASGTIEALPDLRSIHRSA